MSTHGLAAIPVLLAAGCLTPVPPPPPVAAPRVEDWRATDAELSQDVLSSLGAPSISGRFTGSCTGPILLDVRAGNDPRLLASTSVRVQRFTLYSPPAPVATLRYGCDADDDGIVPASMVRAVFLSVSAQTPTLLLPLHTDPDPAYAELSVRDDALPPGVMPESGPAFPLPGQSAPGLPPGESPARAPAEGAMGPPI